MRKTFRPHPEIKLGELKYQGSYDPLTNLITIGQTATPIKTLVHELTHWAMAGFFSSKELKTNDKQYESLREKTDVLTFFQVSIEERAAEYIESMVDE